MISALVGRPGEGKSINASMMMRESLAAGRTVFSNLHLNVDHPNYHYFDTKDFEIIYQLHDGEIWFDEGQMLLDARNWEKLPVEFKFLLQKGRHEGLDFFILTQNIMQIDVLARRLIHEASAVSRLISSKRFQIGLFFMRQIEISNLEKQELKGMPWLTLATRSDWECYNSYALRANNAAIVDSLCACGSVHRVGVSPSLSHSRGGAAAGM